MNTDNNDNIYSTGSAQLVSADSVSNGSVPQFNTPVVLGRQLSSSSINGVMNVGYGNVQINGTTNSINIYGLSGSQSISLGALTTSSNQTGVAANSISTSSTGFGFNVTDANGNSINFGTLADGTFGFNITDSSGFVLFELNASTWKWFDKNYNVNVMQVGELPDSSYGWAVATQGNNVSQAF